jgi:hypothetical protein
MPKLIAKDVPAKQFEEHVEKHNSTSWQVWHALLPSS